MSYVPLDQDQNQDVDDSSSRNRVNTEEGDFAAANYSLQSTDHQQDQAALPSDNNINNNNTTNPQINLQYSMESALIDDEDDSNNTNTIDSGFTPQQRPIQVIQQQKQSHNFDPHSLSASNRSLIANPYISIDKQAAREAQQKQQQQQQQHGTRSHQTENGTTKSGSINAPTPPARLLRTYSPYTPRGAVMLIQDKIQPGSIKGSIFNIIISTVGGGILSLPYGIRYFGYVGGLILLIFSGIISYFSNDLMLVVCNHMNPNIKPSFKTMSEMAGGRCLAMFTQIVLLTQMFGGYISYQVAAGGLLDLAYSVIFPNGNIYIYAVLVMSLLIMFPLSLLNSMSKLRFTSLLGITCSIYLSIVIFIEYFLQCEHAYSKELKWNGKYLPHSDSSDDLTNYNTCFWDTSNFYLPKYAAFPFNDVTEFFTSLLTSFPLFIFSFTCNQYMLPIYVELQRKSRKRMQKVLRRGFSIITLMYILSSLSGFMAFLFATCGNIILNNYEKHYDVVIAAIAISTSMILTNPITAFAWRQNFSLLFWHHREPLPMKTHLIVTSLFTFSATIIALLVTDIATVFGLLGATTYPTVGFVLPGVFFIRIVPDIPKYKWQRRLAWFMSIFVGLMSCAAFVYQIYTFVVPTHDTCHAMQKIEGPDW